MGIGRISFGFRGQHLLNGSSNHSRVGSRKFHLQAVLSADGQRKEEQEKSHDLTLSTLGGTYFQFIIHLIDNLFGRSINLIHRSRRITRREACELTLVEGSEELIGKLLRELMLSQPFANVVLRKLADRNIQLVADITP